MINIEQLRQHFPKGMRVKLVKMNDPQAPPLGTRGTVLGVDDIGSVMVQWDNGSRLSVVYGEDSCTALITPTLIDQIEKIRKTGKTNMLDTHLVQVIADQMKFCELVIFIEEEREAYFQFILTGK